MGSIVPAAFLAVCLADGTRAASTLDHTTHEIMELLKQLERVLWVVARDGYRRAEMAALRAHRQRKTAPQCAESYRVRRSNPVPR